MVEYMVMSQMVILSQFQGVLLIVLAGLFCVSLSIYVFKKNPEKGFKILCGLFIFIFYFQYCDEVDLAFSPMKKVHTFQDLSTGIDWPLKLYKVEGNQEGYIEAVVSPDKLPSLLRLTAFRSGMPAYVFDLKGNLVDSTDDNLDDPRYQDKWYKPSHSPRQQIAENPFSKKLGNQK